MTDAEVSSVSEYGTRLRGRSAGKWLSANGLLCRTGITYEADFSAAVAGNFGLMHARHSQVEMAVEGGTYGDAVTIMTVARGELVVDTGTRSQRLREGDTFVCSSHTAFMKSNTGDVERVSWTIPVEEVGLPGTVEPTFIARPDSDHLLSSMRQLNLATFAAAPPVGSIRFTQFERAIESVAALWLRQRSGELLGLSWSDPRRPLAVRAIRLVEEGFRSPELTVSALAKRLGVSDRHLRRELREQGIAPLDLIRKTRIQHALDDLEVWGPDVPRAWIAQRNGFANERAFSRALEWFQSHPHDTWTGRPGETQRIEPAHRDS